ncbi:TonB-dependent receptor domain-containing protein [Parasphingorhabdus sp.]|uniref:TonB-dependent receptor domain-containing protein n=1 Tax=Parasphingorhabdus sp. TaxID=2709688 RepID=UPI003A91A191
MKFKSKKTALCLASAVTALVACPGIVYAQDQDDDAATYDSNTIVVTGTLIRGVEATGSQTIALDETAIIESGASTTNELLGEIPQIGTFNNRFDGDPRSADRQEVSRPNLRNLPGVNAATGATTLLLVDGHRMTPMGVSQASFDPDFIPPGAIERLEVITDGGSSLYGADAVGGVINFITRKSFDGVQVDGGYDFGDDYSAWNAGITAGTSWERGGAFFSYSTYQRDEILNKDRSYGARGNWNADGTVLTPSGTECLVPVGEIVTWANFGAGWTSNPAAAALGVKRTPVGSPCDIDGESALLPKLSRHSVLFGLTQELSDNLTFEVKANYGESSVRFSNYPLGDTIAGASPNALMIPGAFGDTYDVASVGFSYGVHPAYVDRKQTQDLQVYGITPEFTFDAGGGWQIKTTAYFGESQSSRVLPGSDRAKLTDYVNAGALDPANVAAASTAVVTDILNFETAGESVQDLFLVRTIVDGGLFELPGGTVKAAVGVEYNRDRAKLREGSFTIGGIANQPFRHASRNVKSVFGELSIPVFSMLDLSISGRYDDYSDFGDTFNPNIGFNFTPFERLRIYGHWGESFNAPTALDSVRTANARFIANAAAGVPDPNGELTGPNDDVLLVEGSGGALKPQTAESWSLGFDFEPVDNLKFGANYYDIDFSNLLEAVNPQLASVVLLNPEKFIFNPTQAEFDAFLAVAENGAQFAGINAADVGVIIDRRVANLSQARLKGLDFFANYQIETGFGEVSFGVSGNKQLSFDITNSGNTVDQLEFDVPDFNVAGNIGLSTGGFTGRVTVKHTGGFDTNTAVNQTTVDSFTVTDLYLGYEFPEGSGIADGLTLRVNVDNLFDTDPPVFRQQRNLNYSGFTLGRVFKLSASKKF